MAGYRRFVTYLFQYEYNQKTGNCGFAKVEVRQDRCRVELRAKCDHQGEYPVYLFARKDGAQTGAYLGKLPIRNGSGEAVFLADAGRIGGAPYGIDDMRGLFIPMAEGAFIASQWDDEATDWTRFSPYKETGEEGERTKDGTKTETGSDGEERGRAAGLREESSSVQTGDSGENPAVREEKEPKEKEEDSAVRGKKDPESGGEEESEKGSEKQPGAPPELQGMQAEAAARLTNRCADAWEQQWQHFSAMHPVFRPYDEEALVWGVKLDLRDFRFLPQQYRYLANNSFLLHGFFNYRYVVFGYEGEEDKRWFLGVPGVFHNQEQLLAGIFGFPEFRTKQNCVQRTGEFGYWYRYLEI